MRNYTSPPQKWNAVDNVHSRMLGISKTDTFQRKANGAKSLVERLDRTDNLAFHEGCVNAVNFSPCGELIVSGSDDLQVAIWDWLKNKKEPVITYDSGHSSNVFQTKFMPHTNNTTVVTCARDGQIRVGFVKPYATKQETKKIAQHKGSAHKLSIERGSANIFKTAGEDATVFNIDLRDSKPQKILTVQNNSSQKVALYTIDINPLNSMQFAVGGRDLWARIYDVRKISSDGKGNNAPLKSFCPDHFKDSTDRFSPNLTCLMFSYNGAELLCSYNDEDIYLFDAVESSMQSVPIHCYKGHRNADTVKGVNYFGPYSDYVVSGSDCGHLFIWDKKKENIVNFLEGDKIGVVNVLEPHPTCCILATAGLDHDIKLWQPLGLPFDAEDEKLKKQIEINDNARVEDRQCGPDPFGDQLIFLMMQHLQRQRQRVARQHDQDADDVSDIGTDSSLDSDDDSDASSEKDEAEGGSASPARCVQS